MTTPITVKNEVGRPVNPWDDRDWSNYNDNSDVMAYQDWAVERESFEQSVKSYPCPGIPDTKERETVECELVWQYLDNNHGFDEWIDIDFPEEVHKSTVLDGYDNKRAIYRLAQQPKEQEKEKTAEEEPVEIDVDKMINACIARISELEARVKELEGALKKIADRQATKSYTHLQNIATNALKVNKD